ncbi:MAG: hypothetical protein PHP25_00065 [Candidatus Moranbacteria bacterium]|nr:hypothetical protein [Candidatus Moranbacteria bacterium]
MAINLKKISPKTPFPKKHRREILIGFCALLVLLVRFIFPANLSGEVFWMVLALFFVFPFLIVSFVIKESPRNFGLQAGNVKQGIIFSVILLLVLAAAGYFIVSKTPWRNQLLVPSGIAQNFWYFLWFELIIALPLHFFWEFFFRGFIQLGLEKKLGIFSLFLQGILQTALALKGPRPMIFLVLGSSLLSGFVVWKSRSIYYSAAAMWLVSLGLDIILIRYINFGGL